MKKNFIYFLLGGMALLTVALTGCSDDDIVADSSLGETIYDAEDETEGSRAKLINDFYEKYGTKILYNFKESDLAFNWTSLDKRWYVPANKEGDYVERMVAYLDTVALADYPTSFVKKFLPYRIFLVDSICDRATYSKYSLEDVLTLDTHGLCVAHVGAAMDDMSDDDWSNIKEGVNSALLSSIIDNSSVEPTEFNELQASDFMVYGETDPLGELSDTEYMLYSYTWVNAEILDYYGMAFIMRPTLKEDFGYYMAFIMNNTKTKLDYVFNRFPIVKKRATLVYEYMLENAETNLIEFQNQVNPNDPLPAGYFAQ